MRSTYMTKGKHKYQIYTMNLFVTATIYMSDWCVCVRESGGDDNRGDWMSDRASHKEPVLQIKIMFQLPQSCKN